MKQNLTLNEQKILASKILKVDISIIEKVGFVFPNSEVLVVIISNEGTEIPLNYKGGATTLIVDKKGEFLLYSGSRLSISQLFEEYKKGKRTLLK